MLALDAIWQVDFQQQQFRQILEAMARPGRCYDLLGEHRENEVISVLAVLAPLLDAHVTLADTHDLLRSQDWSMLQVEKSAVEQADFIVCDGALQPNFLPKIGSLSNPEESATLVVMVDKLGVGDCKVRLTGPGVETSEVLAIAGFELAWFELRKDCNASFPLGIDIIFFDKGCVAAMPRSTNIEVL